MAWFSFRRRAKPKCVQRFERADAVVVKVFADLQQARYLKCNQFSGISLRAVERFVRLGIGWSTIWSSCRCYQLTINSSR